MRLHKYIILVTNFVKIKMFALKNIPVKRMSMAK